MVRRLVAARHFRQLVAVRVSGSIADGMLQAALASFVLFSPERQPTPAKILTAFGVLLLPYSILGPFIGVAIDRWRRQRILIVATIARAVTVAGVAAIVAAGNDGSLLAFAVLGTLGIGRFVLATLSAALPHTVDDDLLVSANSVAPTAGTLMSIVGGLVGVTIAGLLGSGDDASVTLILISVLGHMVATAFAARIPTDLLGPDAPSRRTLFDVVTWLVGGVRHMRQRVTSAQAIAMVSMHRIAFGGSTLLVLMLLRNTFNDAAHAGRAMAEFSVVVAVAGAGAFIAAIITPPATRRFGIVAWARWVLRVSALVILGGFALPVLQQPSGLTLASMYVGAAAIGYAGQTVKITSDSLVQMSVDDAFRGRVFAVYDMALNVAIVGGTAIGAVMLPASGRGPAFVAVLAAALVAAATMPIRPAGN